MDNITEIIITGAGSAGVVGSILGYFIKRVIADIDAIEEVLNGKLGKPGLVTQVELNTANDKNTEESVEKLEEKFDKYVKDNPQKEIDHAINKLRHEIELKYRKK